MAKEKTGGFELETATKKDRVLYSMAPEYHLVLKPAGATMLVKDQSGQMVSHQSQGLTLAFKTGTLDGCEVRLSDPSGRITQLGERTEVRGVGYFDRAIDRFNGTGGHIDDAEREVIWNRVTGSDLNGISTGYGHSYGTREMAQRMGGMKSLVQPVNPASVDESTLVA